MVKIKDENISFLNDLMAEVSGMLNTIASESDENYSAYLKQADRANKLLIKYAKGVKLDKTFKI